MADLEPVMSVCMAYLTQPLDRDAIKRRLLAMEASELFPIEMGEQPESGKGMNSFRVWYTLRPETELSRALIATLTIYPKTIHLTGLRNETEAEASIRGFLNKLRSWGLISPDGCELDRVESMMSNAKYKLPPELATLKPPTIARHICRALEGEPEVKLVYWYPVDNTQHVENKTFHILFKSGPKSDKVLRKNLESSFTIKSGGSISQSCPSREFIKYSHDVFIRALERIRVIVSSDH